MSEFEKLYESMFHAEINSVLSDPSQELINVLKAKREFGKTKYKEDSFQISLKNAKEIDTILHAKEEIIDFINYTVHSLVQLNLRGEEDIYQKRENLVHMLEYGHTLYVSLDEYQKAFL